MPHSGPARSRISPLDCSVHALYNRRSTHRRRGSSHDEFERLGPLGCGFDWSNMVDRMNERRRRKIPSSHNTGSQMFLSGLPASSAQQLVSKCVSVRGCKASGTRHIPLRRRWWVRRTSDLSVCDLCQWPLNFETIEKTFSFASSWHSSR